MVDAARENLPADGAVPAYEVRRQRLVAQSMARTARNISGETHSVS